ncbi:hypothetical protein V8B97DRAFT_1975370 [Scleroderma yunnanense]
MKLISFTTLVFASLVSTRPGLKRRSVVTLDNTGSPANGTNGTTPGTPSNSSDAQSSLTLLQSVIAPAFASDGTGLNSSEPGLTPSLTSTNNFINWCATLNLPITNGSQIKSGSCNPAPMGAIPSTSNMPSAKFVSPSNLAVIPANTTFQVALAVRGLETGFFVNADTNYYAAPQQLNMTTGNIMGHSHVVIEQLDNLTQATPTDPTKFAFFAGLNGQADQNGLLYTNVTSGLPEGAYRMASINVAMNHQPALVAVAQRGSLDDAIYFTVVASGANGTSNGTVVTLLPTNSPQQTPSIPPQSTPSMGTTSPPAGEPTPLPSQPTPSPTPSGDDTDCEGEATSPPSQYAPSGMPTTTPSQPTPITTPSPSPSGYDDCEE